MTTDARLHDPTPDIERAFGLAAERMRGLAFVNPALRVQAVDFKPWNDHWLGVLFTPWSINLMILPCERSEWQPVQAGTKRRYSFPAQRLKKLDEVPYHIAGEIRIGVPGFLWMTVPIASEGHIPLAGALDQLLSKPEDYWREPGRLLPDNGRTMPAERYSALAVK